MRLDDLSERPERDALAVGEAASLPPADKLLAFVEPRAELPHEPALADSGLACDGDELDSALSLRAQVRVLEHRELVVAPEERRHPCRLEIDPKAAARACCAPQPYRLGLSFQLDRLEFLVRDSVLRRVVRQLADDDRAGRRRALEPRRGVHNVTRDHRLALGRVRTERDERLAAVDRGARPEPQLADRLERAQRRADSALRVVLVRDRRTEDGHHRVADELLDRAAEPLDFLLRVQVILAQPRANVLGVRGLGGRREADEIDEEDGDDLALLRGCARFDERRAAGKAEPRVGRVLAFATGADPRDGLSVSRHEAGA